MHSTIMIVNTTKRANSAVELESTAWITVVCRSHQPFTGVRRQGTRLCTTIVQKTATVVFENIWTSFATDGPRHADQLSLLWIKWIRNCTDTGEQQVLLFVRTVFKCIFYTPETCDVSVKLHVVKVREIEMIYAAVFVFSVELHVRKENKQNVRNWRKRLQ